MLNRREGSLIITVLLLIVAIVGYWYFFIVSKTYTVTITYDSPAPITLEIFKGGNDHRTELDRASDTLLTINETSEITLKKGSYIIASSDEEDYKPIEEVFRVTGHGTIVNIEPELKDSILTERVMREQPLLDQAVMSRFSEFNPVAHQITLHKLYKNGNWASVVITDGDEGDYFHVVLKKNGSSWDVATLPEIVLSTITYPEIPKDILVDVNSQQYRSTEFRS